MDDGTGSEVVFCAMAAVPATAMVVTGHIFLGAATVLTVVAACVLSVGLRLRARASSERDYLSYAHTATSLGADPAPVIKAMRYPDDDDGDGHGPWVHLPPHRY